MPESLGSLSDTELGAVLAEAREAPAWPESTGIVDAVTARIRAVRPPPGRARLRLLPGGRPVERALRPVVRPVWERLAAAAAAVLIVAAGVLVAAPGARRAVAGWLGLRGERIKVVQTTPRPHPSVLGGRLDLGERVSLAEAGAGVSFHVLVPTSAGLSRPDEVYLGRRFAGGQVSLVYRSAPGLPPSEAAGPALLITEFRGSTERPFVEKEVGPGTTIDSVNVNGQEGFWIAGAPHEILYRDASGLLIPDTVRLAGNVLVFERGDLTVRIEGRLSEAEALRIALSMR